MAFNIFKEKVKVVQKKLDKAAKNNVFHPNKASRKLKRLVGKIKREKKR